MNPVTRYPDVTWAALAAELERELHFRESTYDRAVAKGNMHPDEAQHQLAIARAWREDLHRLETALAPLRPNPAHPELVEGPMQHPRDIPTLHGLDWQTRRAGVQRELTYRARLYPVWIGKGNLTQDDAQRRTRALEAMLDLYEGGFDWPGTVAEYLTLFPYPFEPGDQQKELAL